MKKLVLSMLAAGALSFGGAASAQDLGTILGSIFGLGAPTYSVPHGTQVYVDRYGRQFYYDRYGRQVLLQRQPGVASGIAGYDAWGRPLYAYGSAPSVDDQDGDGVLNQHDTHPFDARIR